MTDKEKKLEALKRLTSLNLPVGTAEQMKRESVPDPRSSRRARAGAKSSNVWRRTAMMLCSMPERRRLRIETRGTGRFRVSGDRLGRSRPPLSSLSSLSSPPR